MIRLPDARVKSTRQLLVPLAGLEQLVHVIGIAKLLPARGNLCLTGQGVTSLASPVDIICTFLTY
ncbi:MAG: hypothetical protein QOH93_2018 [Chloroflexia bacterium]|nr:hypothetical protein [Chloroflexia bacterium]